MNKHCINRNWLSLEIIEDIISGEKLIELSEEAQIRVNDCREYLDSKLSATSDPIYGINTGFGSLCDTKISDNELEKLQENLVISHACGIGEKVPKEIVKLMLLLKIQGLSYGHSGIDLSTLQRLIDFYNHDILPVVFQQGSLGASGDLAPLAHLSLPLIGRGEVEYKGRVYSGKEINEKMGWNSIVLKSKEGLALLNGTQFMSAYGIHCLIEAKRLNSLADIVASVSLDGFDGLAAPFESAVHKVRPHNGQFLTAQNIRKILDGSKVLNRKKKHVQDPYSFRCIPQVHGACKDVVIHVIKVFETEINSVTDNPTIFPEEDKIISAGNFHGQPLAMSLDYMGIALSELGSISERRTYKLISGSRDLPPFLIKNPGVNSGFMIPQYTAASIVSQNKQLASPCSIDSIDSSNGQEDHVSMGANAATKVYRILNNLEKILGIELLSAFQALEMRRPLTSSSIIEQLLIDFRKGVPFVDEDTEMYILMDNSQNFIKNYSFQKLDIENNLWI